MYSSWEFLYQIALDTPVNIITLRSLLLILCYVSSELMNNLVFSLRTLGAQRVSVYAATFSITWVRTKYKVVYHVPSKLHCKWKSFLLIVTIVQWIKHWLGRPVFCYFLCLRKFKSMSSISRKNHHYNCRL